MISIIGAGPIGSYLAYLLAKNKQEVRIFEEHKEIGKPIQCTGIVTEDIYRILNVNKNIISNITTKAKIHSKNRSIEVSTKEIVIKRDKFDKHILDLAVKAGAKLYTSHKYEKYDKKTRTIHFSNKKSYKTNILIGADGPNSKVAKTNNLWKKRDFYIGIQARIKINQIKDVYQVFLGNNFPKFFGWIVPENNKTARIGIAAKQSPDLIFNNFLNKLKIKNRDILEKQGGLIPVYNPKQKIKKENIFLIGDAAGMVKASTGGGLIPGLKAAGILAKCIIKNLDYTKEFNKKLKLNLSIHKKIRDLMNNFSDKDYDIFLKYTRNIKHILNKNSRESPLKLMLKTIIAEPRFLRFIFKIL